MSNPCLYALQERDVFTVATALAQGPAEVTHDATDSPATATALAAGAAWGTKARRLEGWLLTRSLV
ncbi:MAG: hypothetical protein ACYCXX_10260 [Acidiferrobacter thiooxydans]|uniref:hypothetical protein n=1 Tax=Acidiferrobacter sp. SPIII_3 TaxID=1281578 RepID=UPI000D72E29F|nr:hypothetical protein [Acidiferrobacter sp. SPIII_3]AWP21979.1 hypothetical protein C4901_00315 [Acidiferrobacter sp. SPIII_3]